MSVRVDRVYYWAMSELSYIMYKKNESGELGDLGAAIGCDTWFADTWSDSFITCLKTSDRIIDSANIAVSYALFKYAKRVFADDISKLSIDVLDPQHEAFIILEACRKDARIFVRDQDIPVRYADKWKEDYMSQFVLK